MANDELIFSRKNSVHRDAPQKGWLLEAVFGREGSFALPSPGAI